MAQWKQVARAWMVPPGLPNRIGSGGPHTGERTQKAWAGSELNMIGLLAVAPAGFHPKLVILVIFIVTYLGIAMGHVPGLKLNRVGIALLGAIAMMIFGDIGTGDVIGFINWPTILLLFGFFVISAQLRLSGFYDQVANGISKRLEHPARFLLLLMAVTGGLSAILNHDIVCFVFTPIVATALLRKNLNPAPFLIALAIASNFGAAATLIGNPQNMMIGEVAHLDFGRYLLWSCAPVLLAMGSAYGIIWMLSRNRLQSGLPAQSGTAWQAHPFNRPHTIKGLIILLAVVGLFFTSLPKEIVALAAAAIHLASPKFKTDELLGLVDWPILVLFMGLFVVTGAFQSTGDGDQAVRWLAHTGFNLNVPHNLALATAALSNLINNSAAVMLLLKVVNLSRVSAYILALANSFGGSLIILGSVSNIIVVQQARQSGIKISFRDFARLGIPVTLASLAGLIAWVALIRARRRGNSRIAGCGCRSSMKSPGGPASLVREALPNRQEPLAHSAPMPRSMNHPYPFCP
jgi:Na+/H+ antiporter NhaD/arsenite permease-like protein